MDNREYGSSVKPETLTSYGRIQAVSETHHLAINKAIMKQTIKAIEADGTPSTLKDISYERQLRPGLQTDVVYTKGFDKIAVEFHHKSAAETEYGKVAIYILTKLKEYAINYGIAKP